MIEAFNQEAWILPHRLSLLGKSVRFERQHVSTLQFPARATSLKLGMFTHGW